MRFDARFYEGPRRLREGVVVNLPQHGRCHIEVLKAALHGIVNMATFVGQLFVQSLRMLVEFRGTPFYTMPPPSQNEVLIRLNSALSGPHFGMGVVEKQVS